MCPDPAWLMEQILSTGTGLYRLIDPASNFPPEFLNMLTSMSPDIWAEEAGVSMNELEELLAFLITPQLACRRLSLVLTHSV